MTTPGQYSRDDEAGISMAGESGRKAMHVLAIALPLGAVLFGAETMLYLLVPLTLASLIADWARVKSDPLNKLVAKLFGPVMREKELPQVGDAPQLNGATWAFASITALLLLFPAPIAVVAYTMCMIGDGFAAMIGRNFGRHKWGRAGCTVEGSIAYVISAFAIAALIAGGAIPWSPYLLPVWPLLLGAIVAAAVEASNLPGDDNFISPIIASFFMLVALNMGYGQEFQLLPLFR